MGLFDHSEYDDHESVHYFHDAASGLRAIIALHSSRLGPAAGGCRRWAYASDEDALTDVLRLSRGMSYKNAIADLPFGGGKSVILAEPGVDKSAALFHAFGRAVESLNGRYITAEDVGISIEDMHQVNEVTDFVSGLPTSGNNVGGDPSPWTALGVFLGIEAAVKARLGKQSVDGLHVAVQGVGHVGYHLCRLLHEAGATLSVADVNRSNLARVSEEFAATVVPVTEILFTACDVLAPCALGNVLNAQSIPKLATCVVAGAANNQLASEIDGERLAEREILYAPDYVINAGGIINVSHEYHDGGSESQVREDIGRIPGRLQAIFQESAESDRATNAIADDMARRIIAAAGKDRTAPADLRIA